MYFKNKEIQIQIKPDKYRVWRNTPSDAYKNFPYKHLVQTEKEFNLIIKIFDVLVAKFIKETGKAVKLPQRMGVLMIRKQFKDNVVVVDFPHYKRTQEIRKVPTKLLFKGSGSWIVRFYWDKSQKVCNLSKKSAFHFIPTRANKVKLTKLMKTTSIGDKYFN